MREEQERWMRLAIEEAELARGKTGDNPWVGCVIVSPSGELIGRGHTQGPGEDHAEIAAARDAHARGQSVVGASLYSTLEPCAFHGRTPACARSIAERGIARVVIGMHDPHPRVNGEGIRILQAAGVEVVELICESEIRRQLGAWALDHHPHEPLRRAQALPEQGRVARLAEIYGVAAARIELLLAQDLQTCLPAELRSPATTITKIAAGLSGAGVYRVDAGGRAFVLKLSQQQDPLADWRRKLHIQERAALAGLAPAVVHVNEARRAVLSAFVVDQSFRAWYGDPRTHETALVQLGQMLRRLHHLPLPPEAAGADPVSLLTRISSLLQAQAGSFPIPPFALDAIADLLQEQPPASERARVLSHNDVNPTNLIYDGENLLLLDWNTPEANDPLYDLATISVFLRMNDATCQKLIAAYDAQPTATLPARFSYSRRLVAVLCGAGFLHLAQQGGHPGTRGETLASTPALTDFYQRLRSGALSIASAEGQWWFGLALMKEGVTL
jgi:pyrimidine deaminase RibD-like protein/aminoglycoside phosphotransferase (APT) family kinase protein